MSMERSPSSQLASSTPSEEHRNGILRRMYNSLHRPKKGVDPFMDISERIEQEKVREQRKKDVQQRPDQVKQKQHYTVSGTEDIEGFAPKSQSWKGDIKSHFEWEPKTKGDTTNLGSVPSTSPSSTQLQSASESHISAPSYSSSSSAKPPPKPLARNHSLTASSVVLPTNPPAATIKRLSLATDPLSSPAASPSSPSSSPLSSPKSPGTDIPLKSRPEKSKSIPPKPNVPAFKEFRPEKKEKVDMDELRQSYEQSSSPPTNDPPQPERTRNGHGKRNPSRNSVGPDKPMNGVVATIASSRLPSTLLPGLQLLPTDEIRKAALNRPRHPYIPKKAESSGSLFSGTLRSNSSGKYSPRKASPASTDTHKRDKSPAIPIKRRNKDNNNSSTNNSTNVLAGSDSIVATEPKATSPGRSPPSFDLPRSHTETLTGAYGPSIRRQRSHHISNSPPSAQFFPPSSTQSTPPNNNNNPSAISPSKDRPSSPPTSESDTSSIEGYVSIRRKTKARNIKDSLTPASRSLLKSKAAEAKKMQMQVVTAKDLAAYSQGEGKLKLAEIFEQPEEENENEKEKENENENESASPPSTPHRPLSTPTSSHPPVAPLPIRTLSSTSSPAHIPLPPPLPIGNSAPLTRQKPLFPKPPHSSSPSTPLRPSSPPLSPSSSPPLSASTDTTSPTPHSTIPISSPSSPPYPRPPYMLSKSAAKASAKLTDSADLNTSPPSRARVLSNSTAIKGVATQEPVSELGLSSSAKIHIHNNGGSIRGPKEAHTNMPNVS